MKKIFIITLAALLILSLSACSPKESKPSINVRYLTDISGTDSEDTDSVIKVIKSYSANYDLSLSVITPSSKNEYSQSAKDALSSSSDFVLATSPNAISNVLSLAAEYPDRNILVIGSSQNTGLAMEVDFKTEESAYLGGVLAAATTQTGKIAYIGGLAKDDMQSLVGFYSGAKTYNPNVIIYYDYIGSYNDYAAAYGLSQQYFANGVDIVFTNCGASALGVYDVAQSYSAKIINTDMYELPKNDSVIAQVSKHYDMASSYAVEAFMNNEFNKGVVRIGLVVGAVDISVSDAVPEDIKQILTGYKESIKQGTVVPSTWAEYNAYFGN